MDMGDTRCADGLALAELDTGFVLAEDGIANTRRTGAIDRWVSADSLTRGRGMFPVGGNVPNLSTNDYRNEAWGSVDELADEPLGISRRLFGRLLRTIWPQGTPDPLELA